MFFFSKSEQWKLGKFHSVSDTGVVTLSLGGTQPEAMLYEDVPLRAIGEIV